MHSIHIDKLTASAASLSPAIETSRSIPGDKSQRSEYSGKTIIEYIEKIGPFIGGYPVWFQYSLGLWVLLTALMFVGFVLMSPASRSHKEPMANEVDSLNAQLKKLVQSRLAVPSPLIDRYAGVVKSPEAGITKLLSDRSNFENAIRGGGSDIRLQGLFTKKGLEL